jgi:hypothetical protein
MNLPQDLLRELFDYQPDGSLAWAKRPANCIQVGDTAGNERPDGYIHVRLNGKAHYLHRLVYLWHNGDIPPGMVVDHIDEDKTNNCIDNLQLLTQRENKVKSALLTKASDLPTGVRIDSKTKRFVAQIQDPLMGCQRSLGYYDTAELAGAAYSNYVKEHNL